MTNDMSAKGRSSFGRQYKALFLDLDGTTVPVGGMKPSEKVVQAILEADKRLAVCIATGRLLHQALPIIDELKLTGLCVIANGIQIYDSVKKKIVEDVPLNQALIQELFIELKQENVEIRQFDGEEDLPFNGESTGKLIYSLYLPLLTHKHADQISNSLTGYKNITTHKMTITDKTVGLEICNSNATKLHGIARIAKLLGIETKEMIGVGDGYNDFPLLLACGLKVAMGNAVDDLKKIADFVAPSVEEDGVATVIEKFII